MDQKQIISKLDETLLLRYGWPVLPKVWLGLTVASLLLLLTGAGACLKRKGEPRLPGDQK